MTQEQLQLIKRGCFNTKKGFSLVEAMLAISVFGLLVTVLSGVLIYGQRSSRSGSDRQKATFLAEEGLEAVRNIRDEDFSNLVDGQYGLVVSSGHWVLSGTSDESENYTRTIIISSVDEDRKQIVSRVEWEEDSGAVKRSELSIYLSNWQKEVITNSCPITCQSLGYDGGNCRDSAELCVSNSEINEASGDTFCTESPAVTCCCFNNPDTTAPATISNLALSNATSGSIDLSWTAPGDDDTEGTATSYDVRYSTSVIDDSNWADATQLTGEPTPAIAGSSESVTVAGLTEETTYHFAIKAADEAGNFSALSNVPNLATIAGPDTTPPSAISDLTLSEPTGHTITLTWTAPGDDANLKTAASYDIRYSTSLITAANFSSASQASGEPTPLTPGTSQSLTISGLITGYTYYFAIKTADEIPNVSDISNVPNLATLTCPTYCQSIGYVDGVCGDTASYCNSTDRVYTSAGDEYCFFPPFCCCGPIVDVIVPARINNLMATLVIAASIDLTFTAPGDNGDYGTATAYDVRYSTAIINDSNWASATQATNEPVPSVAGTSERISVGLTTTNTLFYLAIKTVDEVGNISPLSNVVSVTTGAPVDKVICTDAFKNGYMPASWLNADYSYAEKYANDDIMRGYHAWGKPVVRIVQNNLKLAKRVYPMSAQWAKHTAYAEGIIKEDSAMGKMLIETAFPLCEKLGKLMREDGQLKYEFSDKDVEDVMEEHYQDYYNLGLSEEELVPLVKKDFETIMALAEKTYLEDRAIGFTHEKIVYEERWFVKFMRYFNDIYQCLSD